MLGHNQAKVSSCPKQHFWDHLTYIIFVSLSLLIILQSFKKMLSWLWDIRVQKFWTQIGLKLPFSTKTGIFLDISLYFFFHFCFLMMLQNFKKILDWILKYKAVKFWAQIKPKLSICPKSEVLKSFCLCHFYLPINPHHATRSQKNKINK